MINIPTSHKFLNIAHKRGLLQTEEELSHFNRIATGAQGEDKFHRMLQQYGRDHWIILRNVWFHNFSHFECDSIVITHAGVFLSEIKNYFGKFVYNNGQCSSRGVPITYNPIDQASNATINLRNLTHQFSPSINVEGNLIFIGERNQVEIHDAIDYIKILECNDVYNFIQEMIRVEKAAPYPLFNMHKLSQHFEKFMIPHPYPPTPYAKEDLQRMRTGIYCANCGSYDVSIKRNYVSCKCGMHEPREEAIVRTVCDYGVLTYGQNFTVSDIYHLLNGKFTRHYLKNILLLYFEQVKGAKIITFENLNQDYSIIQKYFKFKLPKMFKFHEWGTFIK